jgi:exocyst complex component 2
MMRRRPARDASPVAADLLGASDTDSDLSLLSVGDDDDGAAPPPAARVRADAAGAPTAWAHVDVAELERVASGIARSAMPESASAEAVAALAAGAPAGWADDDADPLGLGRLDARTLQLTARPVAAGPAEGRYGARLSALDAAPRAEGAGALRAQLLPSSERFSPELYLSVVHGDAQMQDLLKGVAALRARLDAHAGELKALVKENFDRFISSKDTVDDVGARLRAAAAGGAGGVLGAAPDEVAAAVARAQEGARRAFAPLLERRARAERLRAVLGLLDRQDALVGLPARVAAAAEAGDHGACAAEYRRARALLAARAGARGGGGGEEAAVWARLGAEVDRAVAGVAHSLEAALRSAGAAPAEVAAAARHLAALREAGAPAAAGLDPLALYVDAQRRHVAALLEGAAAEHEAEVSAAARRHRPSSSRGGEADAAPATDGLGEVGPVEAAAVRYVAAATCTVAGWLPQFWRLAGDLAGGGPRAVAVACVAEAFEALGAAVEDALAEDGGLGPLGALAVAEELAAAHEGLAVRTDAPDAAASLEALVALAGRTTLARLQARVAEAAAALGADGAERRAAPPGGGSAHPTTAAVGAARRLAADALAAAQELRDACGRASVDPIAARDAPCRPHELLCGAVAAFAAAAAARAASDLPPRALLALCSDLLALRAEALPALAEAWAPLLAAGAPPPRVRAALAAAAAAAERAEDALMTRWLAGAQERLDGAMDALLFPAGGAAAAPPPAGLRPAAVDLLAAVVAAAAALAAGAPGLLRAALGELLAGLASGVAEVARGGDLAASAGGVLQVWLEMGVLELAAAGLAAGDAELADAFAAMNAALRERLRAALAAADPAQAAAVAAWGGATGAAAAADAAERRLRALCAAEAEAARALVRPLRLVAPPAPPAPPAA